MRLPRSSVALLVRGQLCQLAQSWRRSFHQQRRSDRLIFHTSFFLVIGGFKLEVQPLEGPKFASLLTRRSHWMFVKIRGSFQREFARAQITSRSSWSCCLTHILSEMGQHSLPGILCGIRVIDFAPCIIEEGVVCIIAHHFQR